MEIKMKSKAMFVLLVLCLTACTNTGNSMSDIETPVPTDIPTGSTVMSTVESVEIINIPEQIGTVPDFVEVEVEVFPFADMEYMFLVQTNSTFYDASEMAYFEYALLGGECNSYEKGVDCYENINFLYTREELDTENNELIMREDLSPEETRRQEILRKVFRRHIVGFSSDGERILLKNYSNAGGRGWPALYEIYEDLTPFGSYIYVDIDHFSDANYTKGLQFITLVCEYNFGNFIGDFEGGRVDDFYQSSQVSTPNMIEDEAIFRLSNNIEGESYILAEDAKVYQISKITDPADTIYYKKDSDKEGRQCIGIYTIDSNELIYQSEAIEHGIDIEKKLEKVILLDDKLIVGVQITKVDDDELSRYKVGNRIPTLDYYEIEMNSGKWIYLFTGTEGEFSPDGRFFAGTFVTAEISGYQIMHLETGEYTTIKTYDRSADTTGVGISYVICWVNKDKIDELLELAMQ